MKLIGSIHKRTTDEKLTNLQAAGLTDVRLHLSKIPPERVEALAAEAVRLGMGVYLDTRGNKPTILILTVPSGEAVDMVKIAAGDRFQFYTGTPPATDSYKAIFAMSYLPAVLKGTEGKHIAIDDGNIILKIDEVFEENGEVTGLTATIESVDFDKVDAIYHEGLSSFDIPIHSYTAKLLTDFDHACLERISTATKELADNFVVSFAESGDQIRVAHKEARAAGLTKARIVPKLETALGIEHAEEIADALQELYGDDAELWIGRGDLTVALLKAGEGAVDEAERRVLKTLKDRKIRVIVATNVANSLRYYQPGQQLTADEKTRVRQEIEQGAAGFVMAAEMYDQEGAYAAEAVKLVADTVAAPGKVVINVVGYSGVGKSTVCEYLIQEGFTIFRPSDVIRNYAREHGRELKSNADYVAIHKEMNAHDPDVFVRPVVESSSPKICVDGLRSPQPYNKLKAAAGARMIALVAPMETRLARLQADATRSGHRAPKSLEELRADEAVDRHNDDQNLPNLEAMMAQADYTIDTSALDREQVAARLDEIIAGMGTHARR